MIKLMLYLSFWGYSSASKYCLGSLAGIILLMLYLSFWGYSSASSRLRPATVFGPVRKAQPPLVRSAPLVGTELSGPLVPQASSGPQLSLVPQPSLIPQPCPDNKWDLVSRRPKASHQSVTIIIIN